MRTHSELAIVLNCFLVILLDIVGEVVDGDIVVFDVFHNLREPEIPEFSQMSIRTLFLKPLSSLGVKESALPMTGMTLTRGDRRRISSMSISLSLNYGSLNKHMYVIEEPLSRTHGLWAG
jgi:hypothetical protein